MSEREKASDKKTPKERHLRVSDPPLSTSKEQGPLEEKLLPGLVWDETMFER